MNKILRYSFIALMAMVGLGAQAADVTDVLTLETFGVTGASYSLVTGKQATSDAVYSAQMAGGNSSIQLRSNNNNSGIVSTTSGGTIKSVKIEWNSNTNNARELNVYGSTSAYTDPTELYDTDKQGTLIASFAKSDGDKTITIEGSYQYIGLRSKSGAMYIDKITIVWDNGGGADNRTETEITFADGYATKVLKDNPFDVYLPTATVMAGGSAVAGATVTWESSDENIVAIDGNKLNAKEQGTVTIKASYAGNETYKPINKSYTLKSYKVYFTLKGMVDDVTSGNEKWKNGELVVYLMADEDGGNITPREELVTYANGIYTYITNGTQNMLLYGNELGLAQGDKIKPAELNVATGSVKAIYGTLKLFNGLPELAVDEIDVTKTSTGNDVTPTTITVDNLASNLNAYVKIENAKYVSASDKSLTFKVGDANLAVYNQWSVDISSLKADDTYTLTGMGSAYNSTYQLYLISFDNTTGIEGVKAAEVDAAAPAYNLAGQKVNAAYKGVVIKNGKKMIQK